jgi:hypothetical protein
MGARTLLDLSQESLIVKIPAESKRDRPECDCALFNRAIEVWRVRVQRLNCPAEIMDSPAGTEVAEHRGELEHRIRTSFESGMLCVDTLTDGIARSGGHMQMASRSPEKRRAQVAIVRRWASARRKSTPSFGLPAGNEPGSPSAPSSKLSSQLRRWPSDGIRMPGIPLCSGQSSSHVAAASSRGSSGGHVQGACVENPVRRPQRRTTP